MSACSFETFGYVLAAFLMGALGGGLIIGCALAAAFDKEIKNGHLTVRGKIYRVTLFGDSK